MPMRALVFDGQLQLAERSQPSLGPDEALVRPILAGICNTDQEIVNGYMGFEGILGHEFVGHVVQGPERWIGKRVVGEINFGCGRCCWCSQGLSRHCPERRVLGILNAAGVFAQFVALPVANLHEVPETVADELAVFTEPLAAAFEILEQVDVSSGISALVLGDGKLGLLIAQVLARAGAKVLTVGRHAAHLAVLQARGIGAVLESVWAPCPSPLVVEATGTAAGFALAVKATAPRGTLLIKSTVAQPDNVDLSPIVINEITVVGSRCGPFKPALAALDAGEIDVRSLIEAEFPLSRGLEAFDRAAEPGALKVLLRNDFEGC
jgi:threonine dehydrogenase-like Zn-dependent dehydrogenase